MHSCDNACVCKSSEVCILAFGIVQRAIRFTLKAAELKASEWSWASPWNITVEHPIARITFETVIKLKAKLGKTLQGMSLYRRWTDARHKKQTYTKCYFVLNFKESTALHHNFDRSIWDSSSEVKFDTYWLSLGRFTNASVAVLIHDLLLCLIFSTPTFGPKQSSLAKLFIIPRQCIIH